MSKISVIIPAYNAEKYISETIKSVQQQTFFDWEIIVINDGSADSTLDILNSIRDERLKVFSYENGGRPVARNHGIAHATGEFIAFLDTDDLWNPDCLELQLANLEQHPEADVSYCWFSEIDERGNFLQNRAEVFFEGNIYPQVLVSMAFLQCGALLIRRQVIESVGEFNPCLKYLEDLDYFIRLAHHSSFVLVPKFLLLYRKWSGSSAAGILVDVEQREWCEYRFIEKTFQTAPIELQYLKKQRLVKFYLRIAMFYIVRYYTKGQSERDDLKQAGQRLQKAIQLEPKILFQIRGLELIGKWLLLQTLSPKRFNQIMYIYRRVHHRILALSSLIVQT